MGNPGIHQKMPKDQVQVITSDKDGMCEVMMSLTHRGHMFVDSMSVTYPVTFWKVIRAQGHLYRGLWRQQKSFFKMRDGLRG